MKEYIAKSFKVIKSNLIFVLILALVPVVSVTKTLKLLTLVKIAGPILTFSLTTIAYGRFTEIVKGEQNESLTKIFNKHWLNYLVVSITLVASSFVFKYLIGWAFLFILGAKRIGYSIFDFIDFTVTALTVYTLPLIFIKRRNVITILWGVKILFRNLRFSLPLIALSLLIFIIKYFSLRIPKLFSQEMQRFAFLESFVPLAYNFIYNFSIFFITFIIFIAASFVLIKEPSLKEIPQ